ncbi:hypothetical protein GOODEAATRI_028842 [Goodea atripinnis]|uniref:Uncharacterized protein n=1 Tax=Goodea atripinnis TaxID=208336 RepID=A0ABV0MY26_9TELE
MTNCERGSVGGENVKLKLQIQRKTETSLKSDEQLWIEKRQSAEPVLTPILCHCTLSFAALFPLFLPGSSFIVKGGIQIKFSLSIKQDAGRRLNRSKRNWRTAYRFKPLFTACILCCVVMLEHIWTVRKPLQIATSGVYKLTSQAGVL